MKTNIKAKIKTLLDSHKAVNRELIEKIQGWEKDTFYSASYKQENINKLLNEIEQNNAAFNKKLKATISEEKAALVGTPKENPADYQMQVSNALEFVKSVGKSLTDKQLSEILEPFKDDMKTMKLFNQVVEGIFPETISVAGALAYPFQKTFGKVKNYKVMVNNLDEVDGMASDLLSSKQSLESGIKVKMFVSKIDAIHEVATSMDA